MKPLSPISLRRWSSVHRWSSLVCTVFLLLICVTGLPLVFSDEIDDWLYPRHYADVVPQVGPVDLDQIVAESQTRFPGERITSVFLDDREPQINVWLQPQPRSPARKPAPRHYLRFDARTGELLENVQPNGKRRWHVMNVMLSLHRDLFGGLPGELFMGAMGLLFAAAVVSGVVLYGPFTKHLAFGTVRTMRARRIKWLDIHNLMGISTIVWVLVVGMTGVVNELATPLVAIWLRGDVAQRLNQYKDAPAPAPTELASVQAALSTARRAAPGMRVTEITFPARGMGSPWHYVAWAKGNMPLKSRLFSPVLIDARTGKVTAVIEMPWYLRVLEVSRPLHYGDYGALPLKLIWAAFDVVTLIVLGSGIYLWVGRRRCVTNDRPRKQPKEVFDRKRA